MKKKYSLIAVLLIAVILVFGCLFFQNRSHEEKEEKKTLRVGVTLYRGDDSFINNLCGKMEEKAKAYEKETGVKVILDVVDGKGNQNTQNSQVDRFISLGVDVICVNMVDRSAASYIISRAMEGDIPVIFFNREPVEEDMNRWDQDGMVDSDLKRRRRTSGKDYRRHWKLGEEPGLCVDGEMAR